VVPQVLHAFRPTVLVTQHGCDSHRYDPLADLNLSLDGQRASYLALADLADELCGGRWVSTGGGGYAVLNVVPRAWTHLLGIVSGEPVAPETVVPDAWRAEVGEPMPLTMSDGASVAFRPFDEGISPESRIDQAIIATRNAVFPELGLDPGL
jgi:acetoin utilization protein AcuC